MPLTVECDRGKRLKVNDHRPDRLTEPLGFTRVAVELPYSTLRGDRPD